MVIEGWILLLRLGTEGAVKNPDALAIYAHSLNQKPRNREPLIFQSRQEIESWDLQHIYWNKTMQAEQYPKPMREEDQWGVTETKDTSFSTLFYTIFGGYEAKTKRKWAIMPNPIWGNSNAINLSSSPLPLQVYCAALLDTVMQGFPFSKDLVFFFFLNSFHRNPSGCSVGEN